MLSPKDQSATRYFASGSACLMLLVGGACAASTTSVDASQEGEPEPQIELPITVSEECTDPPAEWIWCDDFEEDRLDSYFEYDDDGGEFTRLEGVGVEGSAGMRARWQAAEVGAGSLHLAFGRTPQEYFRSVDDGVADYRDVYWRLYLRNPPDWIGGGGDKLSRVFVFASPDSWAQAMIGHVWSGSGDRTDRLLLNPASGTDEAGNLRTTRYNDFDNLRWLGIAASEDRMFGEDALGAWYCIEARVRLNTPGISDGLFQLWIDGSLQAERTNLNWLGSFSTYGLNALFIENYWNAGSPAVQERYLDQLVVSTERIGCLEELA